MNLIALFKPKPKYLVKEVSVHHSISQMLNQVKLFQVILTPVVVWWWAKNEAHRKWIPSAISMPKLEDSSLENGHHGKYYLWYLLVVTPQQRKAKDKNKQALEERQSSLFTHSQLCAWQRGQTDRASTEKSTEQLSCFSLYYSSSTELEKCSLQLCQRDVLLKRKRKCAHL